MSNGTKDFTVNITVERNYPLKKFLNLPEVPCQRNTEARLHKARKHLKNLRSEQCVVHLVRLTKDCEVAGKLYSAGMVFRVDGNTRALNWVNEGSDFLPEKLIAITYDYESMDEIKDSYNTFDSAEATEKNQQKLYGILTGFYNYSPKSERLTQGMIISGLNKACHLMKPTEWNQTAVKTEALGFMIGYWMSDGCLQALDELMNKKDKWCQPFICAALMSLRHYGPNNQKLRHAWKLIEKGAGDTMGDEWDGVTQITEEWKTGTFFKDTSITRCTRWDNMNRTVSYILYWLDKYMEDEVGIKCGRGWDQIAFDYRTRITTHNQLEEFLQTV